MKEVIRVVMKEVAGVVMK
jgi:hypothetical protein